MFKKNEGFAADKARKKTEAAKDRQVRAMITDSWAEIKWAIRDGHTRAIVWIFDKSYGVVTETMRHFRNQGYRVIRCNDYILIDWSEEK